MEERKEFKELFDELYTSDQKQTAINMVFTLTVWKGLSKDTFENLDKLYVQNITGGLLYEDEAAQGMIKSIDNINK
jgi:hypothetical protein